MNRYHVCDHTVGLLRDKFLSVNTIADVLNDEAIEWNSHGLMCNQLYGDNKKQTDWKASDFIDGRKSLINSFKYCCDCGEKIDWKDIKAQLKNV